MARAGQTSSRLFISFVIVPQQHQRQIQYFEPTGSIRKTIKYIYKKEAIEFRIHAVNLYDGRDR